ncbi:hypothetical protein P9X10_00920 [Bacillus cereus]|nr:hypothetical protein [Bacillus cereus]
MELIVLYGGLTLEQNHHIEKLVDRSPKNLKAKSIGDKVSKVSLKRHLRDDKVVVVFLNEKDYINFSTIHDDERLTMISEVDDIFASQFGVVEEATPILTVEDPVSEVIVEDYEIESTVIEETDITEVSPLGGEDDGWGSVFEQFGVADGENNTEDEVEEVKMPVAVATPISPIVSSSNVVSNQSGVGVMERETDSLQVAENIPTHTDAEFETLEKKVNSLNRINANLREQVTELNEKFDNTVQLEQYIEVKREKESLLGTVNELNETIKKLENEKSVLDSKLTITKADTIKVEAKVSALTTEIDELNSIVKGLNQEIDNLNAEITRISESNAKLKVTNDELETSLEQEKQKLSLAKMELESNQNLISTLQSENRNLQTKNDALLEDNENLIATNKNLTSSNQDLLDQMKRQLEESSKIVEEAKTEPITFNLQSVKPVRRKYPNVTFIVPLSNLTVVDTYKYIKSIRGDKLILDLTNNSYIDYIYRDDFKLKGGTTPTKWLLDGKPYGSCFMQKSGGHGVEIISYMMQPKPENLFKRMDWDRVLSDISREQQVFINLGSITEDGVVDVLKAVQGKVDILGVLGESAYDQRSAFMYLQQLDSYRVLAKHNTKDKAKIGITERW